MINSKKEIVMDDFNEPKKDILHCLSVVADDVIDLPNTPTKQKVDLIIQDLYEVMRKLSAIAEQK